MKKILLISYNFNPEPTGIGKYNGEMIDWMVKQGYDCTVITSYPYYPYWKVQEPYYKKRFGYTTEVESNIESGGKLKTIRCPMFVPEKPTGLSRIILDLTFFISAFFKVFQLLFSKKIDFVITVAPSFQIGLLGVLYKKLRKAKMMYHIQDMQIEAAKDLKMIKSEFVIKAMFKVEDYIFRNSDIVSSISEGMVKKIQSKAKKETFLFPNWTDTQKFFPIEDRASLKQEFGFNESDKVILYSGAIGEKQGLESILYAASEFKKHKELKFLICGSGPYKEKLIELSKKLELSNLIFFPLQPFDKFNQFLNMADLHLVIQKANASDLVMPSKLTTILAVGGLALVTANSGAGLHTLVDEHKMGILVDAENQNALNLGIKSVLEINVNEIKRNAREYAETFLAIENVMGRFETNMLQHKGEILSVAIEPSPKYIQQENVLELDGI